MTWDTFYERYYEWAPSTLTRNISKLESIGTAEEVTEVILLSCNEKQAEKLLEKHLAAGVAFTESAVEDLLNCATDEMLGRLVLTIQPPLTDSLLELMDYINCTPAKDYVVTQLIRQGRRFTEWEANGMAYTLSAPAQQLLDSATIPDDDGGAPEADEMPDFDAYQPKKQGCLLSLLEIIGWVSVFDALFDGLGGKKKK